MSFAHAFTACTMLIRPLPRNGGTVNTNTYVAVAFGWLSTALGAAHVMHTRFNIVLNHTIADTSAPSSSIILMPINCPPFLPDTNSPQVQSQRPSDITAGITHKHWRAEAG